MIAGREEWCPTAFGLRNAFSAKLSEGCAAYGARQGIYLPPHKEEEEKEDELPRGKWYGEKRW